MNELAKKSCIECNKNIPRRAKTMTYKYSVCKSCIDTLPKYLELKRNLGALRARKYYNNHLEQERKRSSENWKKTKELRSS